MRGRFYDNGTCHLLSTHGKIYQHFFNKTYKPIAPIPTKLLSKKFYYFIPEECGEYKQAIYDGRHLFGLSNFIDLIERHNGYFDISCFASDIYNTDILNYYLNNIDALEKFSLLFDEQAANLINQSKINKLTLPNSMLSTFSGIKTKNTVNPILSKQQTECLRWLIKGMTAKQIAKSMNLSPRTIESYIENIKCKFNCTSRIDLIVKALESSQDCRFRGNYS